MLAPSAYLASAAGSSCITKRILPSTMSNVPNTFKADALAIWSCSHTSDPPPPSESDSSKQKAWDTPHVNAAFTRLLEGATTQVKGRLLAVQRKETGAWLTAPPVSSLGLRLEDEAVRIGVGLRLGLPLCTAHKCTLCGNQVDVHGTHGLHCHKKAGVHSHHAALLQCYQGKSSCSQLSFHPGTCRPLSY